MQHFFNSEMPCTGDLGTQTKLIVKDAFDFFEFFSSSQDGRFEMFLFLYQNWFRFRVNLNFTLNLLHL